ncbi:hypothetical protein V8E54_013109 [Elaphomyces granulatus]
MLPVIDLWSLTQGFSLRRIQFLQMALDLFQSGTGAPSNSRRGLADPAVPPVCLRMVEWIRWKIDKRFRRIMQLVSRIDCCNIYRLSTTEEPARRRKGCVNGVDLTLENRNVADVLGTRDSPNNFSEKSLQGRMRSNF